MRQQICLVFYLIFILRISCTRNFENFPDIIKVLCKHFEIETLDHVVFLSENDDFLVNDATIDDYHQNINQLAKLNFFVNTRHKPSSNSTVITNLYHSQNLVTSPILFYIGNKYLTTSKGKDFITKLSALELSTHIWLFNFYSSKTCNQSVELTKSELVSSIAAITLDSQIAMLLPSYKDCDTAKIYEVYKVNSLFLILILL